MPSIMNPTALFAYFTRPRNTQTGETPAVAAATSPDQGTAGADAPAQSVSESTDNVEQVDGDFEPISTPAQEAAASASNGDELPASPTADVLAADPDPLDAKAARAHEVARQRVRHTDDRRKTRAQKAKGVKAKRGAEGGNALVAGDREADAVMPLPSSKGTKGSKDVKVSLIVGDREEPTHSVSLSLGDLVVRDAKVRKEKVGGFEVVPSLRTVIALDKFDFEEDVRVPRPVTTSSGSSDDDSDDVAATRRKLGRSYAQAVLASSQ